MHVLDVRRNPEKTHTAQFLGRSHGRVVAASEGRGRGDTCVDSSSVDHEMAGAQGRMEAALCVEEREVPVDLAGASLV